MAAAAGPIGFIGLGMMGLPMARSLIARSFRVLGCDTSEAARAAVAEGAPEGAATFAATPAAVAAGAEVVVLMLPNSRVIASVMEGEGGLLAALRPGMLVIDMSSSEPGETRRLAALAAERGAMMADAPVSGSVAKAKTGTLAIMVGGDDATFARAEPVLKGMGEAIIRTGTVGSAHAMKALNNYVYAAGLLATAEALRMGEALGLDLGILTDVMNASSGRNIATETKSRQEIISGRYAGGFQLGLMRKDLDTAGSIAAETGFPAAMLALCCERWAEAVAALGPKVDNTEIHRFIGSNTSKG
ncbi:NAD(P)-dependent oxidoreductase [Roseomonas terrae]|jgi:3-hydroxyisobutyrate dehydrogenase|uniref:NAD(P)-dependent oxidoreductase n=1 Tax=Neoroseomonas terrae TaxID=424799 RepID=A0ABS5EF73_9PROT|nr:NAD(P)-dependent oxidoreductase [Neoroseomonas terrae]MBR0649668.1 NAD(P)-dependent oxidoreductase [Neoroseomonas terrae]